MRNRVVLPLPFGPSSPNSSAGPHVERHAVQRGAIFVAVDQILYGNDGATEACSTSGPASASAATFETKSIPRETTTSLRHQARIRD